MIKIIEPFKKNPLFLDLKGKFLSSVVSSLSRRKIEGFLLVNRGEKQYVFFLRDTGWDSGFCWQGNQSFPVEVRDVESLCAGEETRASFYQSRIELLDIILDKVKDPVLLTEAACVNSSILTFLIEEAERDGISAYFKLEWNKGQKAYILVKSGDISQRVFIDDRVITGDEAGKQIISTIETSPCNISLFEISSVSPGTSGSEKSEKILPHKTDKKDREIKKEVIVTTGVEPVNFKEEYIDAGRDEQNFATKLLDEDKLPKEERKKKNAGIFSAIFNRHTPEIEKESSPGQNVENYSFPLFNKKPTDKIIKTVSEKEIPLPAKTKGAEDTVPSADSFKDHVLKSYFSLAEGYEEDGNIKKACAVLEEALEVPQIDRLSVYRYYLSVCRKNNLFDKELDILKKMSLEYKGEAKVLTWVNRQIAILYVKKGQMRTTTEKTGEGELPLRKDEGDLSPKSFLARIFHKDDRKK